MKKGPPKLAEWFFTWYCNNHLQESILGDLEEQFYQNQEKYGGWQARLRYCFGVLLFINRFTLQRDTYSNRINHYSPGMIKNNLISSFRFFRKNKGFTFINIFGLSLGLSSFLLILFFINHELSFDRFLENSDQVYRINFAFQDNSGNVTTLVNSPPALAPGIRGKFSELDKITQLRYAMNCLLSYEDKHFYENQGYFADSLFLEVLPYELLSGDAQTALDQPNSIVLTEELALKYFNDPNPLGASIILNNEIPLTVTGILEDLPNNSHLDFNFLVSFASYEVPAGYASDLSSWGWLGFLTYASLKPNTDPERFETGLIQHFKMLDPNNPNPMRPIVQNVSDIYLGSTGINDDLASPIRSGNRFNVRALLLVSILILLIAGFNFSNLSHALAINRRKVIGIRKILGADRRSIFIQLLVESLVLALCCLLLALGITLFAFPYVAQLMAWDFSIKLAMVWEVIPILVMVGVLIGMVSSFYPAISLAQLDLMKAIKGISNDRKPRVQLKKVLLTLQFAIAIGLISATIIMGRQIHHLRNTDTGYQAAHVVLIEMLPTDMRRFFEVYKDQLVTDALVAQVSRSERVLGDPWPFSVIRKQGEDPAMNKRIFFNQADYDYFTTMDIPISMGRDFSKDYINDPSKAIILNQQAVEYLGLADPIGTQVHFFELDGPRTVIGVAEDFNYASLHEAIGPAAMILPFIDLEYMYVRFNPGNPVEQIAFLEDTWQSVAGDTPLEWRFLDANLKELYDTEKKMSMLIQAFSVLAILLACLGLLGMVTFMVNNRVKEVGVRKVLGASIPSLYTLFIKPYLFQTILAMLIMIPLVHYFLSNWLHNFAYHIQIPWWTYPISAGILIVIILITVSFQILSAAGSNPTSLLRQE